MSIEFRNAAVLGTGMMGPGIALTLAIGGVSATIVGRTEESAAGGLRKARAQAELLEQNDLDSHVIASALDRLRATTDFEDAVGKASLVVESTPESLAFKQELFERLDRTAPRTAVLASNTSGLSITAIAARCEYPERVLTTHFWNPPHLVPLVEIVRGERTSPEVANAVRDLLARCGKTPVVVKKDRPGQLGNRLQMALVREAVHIVAEGIAGAEEIDAVLRDGLGLRMPAYGTLEHMDIAGVDLALSVADYVTADLYNAPTAPEYMREMVRSGRVGAKSGEGFYDWSVKNADEVRARRDRFLVAVARYRRQGETSSSL